MKEDLTEKLRKLQESEAMCGWDWLIQVPQQANEPDPLENITPDTDMADQASQSIRCPADGTKLVEKGDVLECPHCHQIIW